jgi:uncharacterized membrane protein YgdD (TMEM256/DUF423 family)
MLAVIVGAFGAHALRDVLPLNLLAVYQTGVQYHFYHSIGILVTAILSALFPERRGFWWAGWLMFAGIVLFSGSLYALALTGYRILGAITPLGGVAFVGAWATVAGTTFRITR